VGNAIKFTHEGEIRICLKAHFKDTNSEKNLIKLEIEVVDTGIGIPEESYKVIFESFRQHSQLDSRKYGGTGLGLSITKRLVEAMNGRIKLKSTVGRGSTFRIIFPNIECSGTHLPSSEVTRPVTLYSDSRPRDSKNHSSRQSASANAAGELNIIKDADYHQLMSRFENELNTKWQMFHKKQPLKEIQSFAGEIVNLGKSYKLDFISEYGEQLLSAIENFEIEEIRLKLSYFPELLQKLKTIGYEHS